MISKGRMQDQPLVGRLAGVEYGMLETQARPLQLGADSPRMYRRSGFRLTWERDRRDLGSPITFQGYRLELG